MDYLYGEFSDEQIKNAAMLMHKNIHRLLLYKDNLVTTKIFNSDEEFKRYFENILFKFGGLNTLLGYPEEMVFLMYILHADFYILVIKWFNYFIFIKQKY